ncbi:MAG: ABC transporter ATP-binding protein [Reyranellaceae bacterium]
MLLALNRVCFGFRDENLLLDDFNLTIDRGEFLTLLGPSGCGKSTILNLAAGLLFPLNGEVLINGVRLATVNDQVGYMTQGDTLLPWITVARNITMPLEFRGLDKRERQQRLDQALKLVNLEEARNKYPSELSGGMKRRALLARSMIYDPPMLLMDEPFSALDPQLREVMHQELVDTVHGTAKSVLFVTHDISEALLLSDRILVLGGSPLAQIEEIRLSFGKPRDLTAIRVSPEYVEYEKHLRQLLRASAN